MSLRTSAHTGVAIRVPAEKPDKLALLRANSWHFSAFALGAALCHALPQGLRNCHVATLLAMTRGGGRPCTRRNVSGFCMSLRTMFLQPLTRSKFLHVIANQCSGAPQRGTLCGERSHKGALLPRWPSGGGEHGGLWGDEVWQSVFPAGKPSKLALLWANSLRLAYSPKALLLVLPHCKENGLSRRHAPRNDMQRLAGLLRVQPRPPRAAYHPAKTGAAPHDFGKSC